MYRFPVNCGSRIIDGQKWCRFGESVFVGYDPDEFTMAHYKKNPRKWRTKKSVIASTILIGLDVDGKKTWTVKNVIKEFSKLRSAQIKEMLDVGAIPRPKRGKTKGAAASFVAQKGLWHDPRSKRDPSKDVEDSVQIIVISDIGESPDLFRANVEELADEMATKFRQQLVYVHHQKNGIIVEEVAFGI